MQQAEAIHLENSNDVSAILQDFAFKIFTASHNHNVVHEKANSISIFADSDVENTDWSSIAEKNHGPISWNVTQQEAHVQSGRDQSDEENVSLSLQITEDITNFSDGLNGMSNRGSNKVVVWIYMNEAAFMEMNSLVSPRLMIREN